MERIELIEQMLKVSMKAATAQMGYRDRPRKYTMEYNLYLKEVHFIVAVGPDGQPSMGEMAHRLKVTQGAVTQIVVQLEKKGYLTRSKDPMDHRRTIISLTEKGKQLCAEHIAYDQEKYLEISEFFGDFTNEEIALFVQCQNRLLEMYTNHK